MRLRAASDPHNVTLAMLVAGVLACCKDASIPERVKWHLNAYTNWNLALIAIRYALSIHEWDPFLCVNSIGILMGFRTAFAQGLDDNIRRKLNGMGGRHIARHHFLMCDFLVHTLPAAYFATKMVHQRRRIPMVSITYAITLSTWFAFHQGGKLDASHVYVPHPWKRSWIAAVASMALTPAIVESAQASKKLKLAICILGVLLPYASTRLDPTLKRTYDFECLVHAVARNAKSHKRSASDGALVRA